MNQLKLFSRAENPGQNLSFRKKEVPLEPLIKGCFKGLDLVFFSAGEEISREWAEKAVSAGSVVIDNSAAFRMEEDIPLVVPEINIASIHDMESVRKKGGIIANPNCSTIQLVLALWPLEQTFGLESVCVASYQSMSGAGRGAVEQFKEDSLRLLQGEEEIPKNSPAFNCLPQIGTLDEEGFSTEEQKLMQESKKILNLQSLEISATAVRTPTFNGHAEAVWLRLKKPAEKQALLTALVKQKGLQVVHEETLAGQRFVDGWDDVYVGRIRSINDKSWLMWIAADNLRKGAALNGLQIAEHIFA